MEEIIFKFLDEYIGDNVRSITSIDVDSGTRVCSFFTKDGDLIFFFTINVWDKITTFRTSRLCETVSGFFSIPNEDAKNLIKDWFDKKYNIVNIKDLKKFIEE